MVIGIDIGGTKTRVRSVGSGRSAVDRVVPTVGWRNEGLFDDSENARRLLGLAMDAAGSLAGQVIVVGAHGCDKIGRAHV